MKFPVLVIIACSLLSFAGCEIINPAEKVPTYVHVDSFQFISSPGTGTASHKITNVLAYLDYAPLGTFDLPADIPILADKPASLMLMPAIQFSGMADRIVAYPFYQADTSTLIPAAGKRITLSPVTRYFQDSLLNFTTEDFEAGNAFVNLEGDTMVRSSDPQYVYEGNWGGVILLKDTAFATNILSTSFSMPTIGSNKAEVYLEMNYKCSVPFVVGLQTSDGSSDIVNFLYGFNARSSWNKVYIGLEEFLTAYPNRSYRVIVRVAKDKAGEDYVAFDNFKVVSRK